MSPFVLCSASRNQCAIPFLSGYFEVLIGLHTFISDHSRKDSMMLNKTLQVYLITIFFTSMYWVISPTRASYRHSTHQLKILAGFSKSTTSLGSHRSTLLASGVHYHFLLSQPHTLMHSKNSPILSTLSSTQAVQLCSGWTIHQTRERSKNARTLRSFFLLVQPCSARCCLVHSSLLMVGRTLQGWRNAQ